MKLTIDPITRIEGHLKVEVEIKGDKITDAKCSADMYRGIEKALKGYDYLTAIQITQRTCGCCPYAHAEAAALAIENALGIELNKNGKLLRNMVIGAYKLKDYLLHFYTLSSLDFVRIDALLDYNGDDRELLEFKKYLLEELSSKRVFPNPLYNQKFKNAYMSDFRDNIFLIKGYLESFEVMKQVGEMVKIFGSKTPHMTTIEAGGVTTLPSADRLLKYINLAKNVQYFIHNKYLPDVIRVAKHFKEYFNIGKGVNNFLTFDTLLDLDGNYEFVGGFSKEYSLSGVNPENIVEYNNYAYYKEEGGYKPLELQTLTPISFEEFKNEKKKYSWSRAPRYEENVVEVGPSAIIINTYLSGKNRKLNTLVDKINSKLGINLKDYNSVMGRHLARAIISSLIIDKLVEDSLKVDEGVLGFIQLKKPPSNVRGVGVTEATRGALAHFIEIGDNGFIKNYDMIVPTTWNISPKDDKNRHGALELMLIDTKIDNPSNPIEITRIVRSIDPCLACAVH